MKANESSLDRIIRLVFAIVSFVLYFTGVVGGTLGIVTLAIGVVLLLTALIGFCPLYALLKVSTKKS